MRVGRLAPWAVIAFALMFPAAAAHAPAGMAQVEVAFTPGDDVAGTITGRIHGARDRVQVQAYLFTDRRIARALFAALRRGVAVEVIGDAAQQRTGGLPWLAALARAGARVYLEDSPAASHNKIVIVDGGGTGASVITGSYNFTRSARTRNAENVVVISGNRGITDRFVRNFEAHRNRSTPWR
jgi:phosphatidylserine/phosphatidylglycerophosphate/cardiolipin synthase-like enzyme